MERLGAWTSVATVEKIGPSSEASAASQSCSRRLKVSQPSGSLLTFGRFALSQAVCRSHSSPLPERPALAIGVPAEPGCTGVVGQFAYAR